MQKMEYETFITRCKEAARDYYGSPEKQARWQLGGFITFPGFCKDETGEGYPSLGFLEEEDMLLNKLGFEKTREGKMAMFWREVFREEKKERKVVRAHVRHAHRCGYTRDGLRNMSVVNVEDTFHMFAILYQTKRIGEILHRTKSLELARQAWEEAKVYLLRQYGVELEEV